LAYAAGTSRDSRRTAIAAALTQEISVVAPSRLLALLQQGVKWQQHTGTLPTGASIDLFRGRAHRKVQEEEKLPTKLSVTIKFGKTGQCNAAAFSPDGQFVERQPNFFKRKVVGSC
jgi:WD40 repeat-containing protein SMU1